MIKSVTVTNYVGDSIKLELGRPELSGLIIESIDGIGPGKASINTSSLVTKDGSIFTRARASDRNITIRFRFLWHDTIEDARHLTYKYFPLKQKLNLVFETDRRSLAIDGYVESNEPDIFSKESGTDISIICPYPFFYSTANDGFQVTSFGSRSAAFEFPFSNESLSENLLELGIINRETQKAVFYEGDVDTGCIIRFHVDGRAVNLAITNLMTREFIRIDSTKLSNMPILPPGMFDGAYDIEISTEPGNKYVHLISDGAVHNIINCIDKDMDWFVIRKGENIFVATADSGLENVQITIENRIVYEGV